jgi:hypothetical protein
MLFVKRKLTLIHLPSPKIHLMETERRAQVKAIFEQQNRTKAELS